MSEGKVLAAAKAKGLDSLAKVAQALIDVHPELFEGIAVRSLGAKLSELNRENVTWWRSRADRLEVLKDLLGLEPSDLLVSEQARRRGLWVCEEFPELPALNLESDRPPTLAEPVAIVSQDGRSSDLDEWLRAGLGSDYEQHPMARLPSGVTWLHVPKGTGRSLLLSRIKARGRLDVFEGKTFAQVVAQASRLRPAVLAPIGATAVSELGALAGLGAEQPVLIISAHPSPIPAAKAMSQSTFPSWEWLSATHSERARSVFTVDSADMSGGIFAHTPIIEFRLQLVPAWRARLLAWVEERVTKHPETLFTAEGLSNWLGTFDPDGVLFPTPAAVLSLARICHEVGERRLPKPSSPNAGMQLVKQLGRADSRYQSLLARLVKHCWLDADTSWQHAKPWDDWLTSDEPTRAQPEADQTSNRRARSAAVKAMGSDLAPLTENDLDAAVKSNLLIPDSDGNYGFRSYAEAALVLRDQLRGWMQAGEFSKWGAQVVGDAERQQLVDEVLKTLGNQVLLEMCQLAARLPTWNAEALGVSETLFLAAGLRMAEGSLGYSAELGDLLMQTLARCIGDEAYIQLPVSRSLLADVDGIDWTCATWGWSLIAPKPEWVPIHMADRFPGWAADDVDWLGRLPIPESRTSISAAHFRRLAAAVNTAVDVAGRVGLAETSAPEVRTAIVSLMGAMLSKGGIQKSWWQDIVHAQWALEVIELSLVNIGPAVQRALATSLLEACGTPGGTQFSYGVYALVGSRLWLKLLNVKDAAELWDTLAPAAMGFVVRHIQSVPPLLRQAVADKIDPAELPHDFDWHALLSVTDIPHNDRLDQLLSCWNYGQNLSLSAALWTVRPDICLQWATDPHHPHHELFLEQCPPQWLGKLAEALALAPGLVTELNIHPSWAASRIADARASMPALLALLSAEWGEKSCI